MVTSRTLALLLTCVPPAWGVRSVHQSLFRSSSYARSALLRMGVADRMASHGLLYDGWGADGLKSLNQSNRLLDEAENAGVNRYDLTRIVAAKAKELAYANCADNDMSLNPMLSGSLMSRPPKVRKPHVMEAINGIQDEMESGADETRNYTNAAEAETRIRPSPAEARAGASVASSLDGDGGAANLQKINEELLQAVDAKSGPSASTAGDADVADGLDELLADLGEVDLDEDDDNFDDVDLEIESLFGSVVTDTDAGSFEARGMHPGD